MSIIVSISEQIIISKCISQSLQKYDAEEALDHLRIVMEENEQQKAALALQSHYERAISNNKELHRLGCLGN